MVLILLLRFILLSFVPLFWFVGVMLTLTIPSTSSMLHQLWLHWYKSWNQRLWHWQMMNFFSLKSSYKEQQKCSEWVSCIFFVVYVVLHVIIYLQHRYSQNPLALLKIIRHCLGTELKLVQQAENVSFLCVSNVFIHMLLLQLISLHLKVCKILQQAIVLLLEFFDSMIPSSLFFYFI